MCHCGPKKRTCLNATFFKPHTNFVYLLEFELEKILRMGMPLAWPITAHPWKSQAPKTWSIDVPQTVGTFTCIVE